MLDSMQARVVVLRQPKRGDVHFIGPERLRESCLHPAEIWALKRRAARPYLAPRRLPAVARTG